MNYKMNNLQRAYWLGKSDEIDWGGNSCSAVFQMNLPDLDERRFTETLRMVFERNRVLQTVADADLTMRFDADLPLPLRVGDLSRLPAAEQAGKIAERYEILKYKVFAEGEALFNLELYRTGAASHVLLMVIDMVLLDLSSMYRFWDQMDLGYRGLPLPAQHYEFQDYARALASGEAGSRCERDKAYWQARVDAFPPPPALPMNSRAEVNGRQHRYRHRQLYLSAAEWEPFSRYAAEHGMTASAALMTLYASVLCGWSGQTRFALNITTAQRRPLHPDCQTMLGEFTGVLYFEAAMSDDSLASQARRLQKQLWSDFEHRDYDGIEFLNDLYRAHGERVIYPYVFTSGLEVGADAAQNRFLKHLVRCESKTPQVLLDHQVFPWKGGVVLSWDSCDDAFLDGVVDDLFECYGRLIRQAASGSAFWEASLDDLRSDTVKQVLDRVNRTAVYFEPKTLHEAVFQISDPDRIALIDGRGDLRYGALAVRCRQMITLLKQNGLSPGDRVVICLNKDRQALIAMLAVLAAGMTYIPVLPDQPDHKLRYIIETAGARAAFIKDDRPLPDGCIRLSAEAARLLPESDMEQPDPDRLAYILFTSGTTGEPKGVCIRHRAAMNTVTDVNRKNRIGASDRTLAVSSLAFDLSVYDCFGIWAAGGAVVLVDDADRMDPAVMLSLIMRHRVTVWNSVPVLFSLWLTYFEAHFNRDCPIRHIFLSGDWIPLTTPPAVRRWLPRAELIAMGGATEASIWSNDYRVDHIDDTWASVPYGFPLANQQFYVLDPFLRPCPIAVPGRLYIAGDGLADGYCGQPQLTADAFIVHPRMRIRLYDTGDYGRYRASGELEFLGRKDNQVKINGYRIELGEIEQAFSKIGYDRVCILPVGARTDHRKLVAFIVGDERPQAEVAAALSGYLAPYFLPDMMLFLDELPSTANQKTDRNRLMRLYEERRAARNNQAPDEPAADHPVLALLGTLLSRSVSRCDSLSRLGVSSIELIRLAGALEEQFGIRPGIGDLMRYQTLNELCLFYENQTGGPARRGGQIDEAAVEGRVESDEITALTAQAGIRQLQAWCLQADPDPDRQRIRAAAERELQKRARDMHDREAVFAAVADALKKPAVRGTDAFFALGVSSLEMIQVANCLESRFLYRPSVADFMHYDSLEDLWRYYQARRPDFLHADEQLAGPAGREDAAALALIRRCQADGIYLYLENGALKFKSTEGKMTDLLKSELKVMKHRLIRALEQIDVSKTDGDRFPLTPIQFAYVMGRQDLYELGSVHAHYYIEFEFCDPDIERLNRAVNRVIGQQEALRTRIDADGWQTVMTEWPPFEVGRVRYSGTDELEQLREAWTHHRYELGTWPMFSIFVSVDESGRHRLHFSLDCIILDGWSVRLFMQQVFSLYLGLPVRFPDYTFRNYLRDEPHWLRSTPYRADAEAYWEKQLDLLPPPPALPYRQPFAAIKTPRFKRLGFELDAGCYRALREKAAEAKLTLSAALVTIFMRRLSRCAGNADLTLNLTLFNRHPLHAGINDVLGDFTNITLLPYFNKGLDFAADAAAVQRCLWDAIDARCINGVSLLRRLSAGQPQRAVMPVVFTSMLGGETEAESGQPALEQIREVYGLSQTPQVVLDHQLHVRNGGLYFNWDYVEAAFDEADIRSWIAAYRADVLQALNEDWIAKECQA